MTTEKTLDEKVAAINAAHEAGKLPPEKEQRFVELLKAEYLLLLGAALGACHTGDTAGLFELLKILPTAGHHPKFKPMLAEVEAIRAERAKRVEELQKPAPKKSAGPSPWGL